MLSDIQIISVLTFSILTLHSQPHANEIYKNRKNPNENEFSNINADQSKAKYATKAQNNSQVNEYGEFYPDYKAKTLQDFLHEWSGIAGNAFSKYLEGRQAYRKARCPSPMSQNYVSLVNSKKEKERKVRLNQQYPSERINKSIVVSPWNKQYNGNPSGWQANNNNSNKYLTTTNHFKYDILFPQQKVKSEVPLYNHSQNLLLTALEYNSDSKWPSFVTASVAPVVETSFSSNYYSTYKGKKVPVPEILLFKKYLFPQEMHPNKTKYSHEPEKSTKTVSSGDRLPEEGFLFFTTTTKVFRAKGSHVTNPMHQDELQQLSFENESSLIHNTSSLNFQNVIDESVPSMNIFLESSNEEQKIKGKAIDYQNNVQWLTVNTVLENKLEPKLFLPSTQSYFLRNAAREIGRNDLEYFNNNKEKTPYKNQQEALFVSEKDYKAYEKNQRSLDASQNVIEKGENSFAKNLNMYPQNRISNASNAKRGISMALAKEFIQKRNSITTDVNLTGGIYQNSEKESVLLKNMLNQKIHKRVAFEKNGHQVNNDVLGNLYDDYDYYFVLGDNNTDERPFKNDHRAKTAKNVMRNRYSMNDTASYKSEKWKNLKQNKKKFPKSDKEKISAANNAVGNFSTSSPSIIRRIWSNVGNRKSISLKDGKNYILNLFRKKDNYSEGKGLISSTTAQTIVKNFLFRKRSNSHGDGLRRSYENRILEDLGAKDGNYRKRSITKNMSKKMGSYSISSHTSLAPDSKYKSFRQLDKRNVMHTIKRFDKRMIPENSIFESNDDAFEVFRKLERPKRRIGAAKKGFPLRLFPHSKHFRRSVFNNEMEDYNTKFQNLQKDLLELQKAIASPKAARPARNEEKNLTLQIRVIVDVVNNSLGPTENQEDEQLKKRDTKLVEKLKKVDTIPMPLEHESPLVEEKKGTDVWRNKRVDGGVKESHENDLIKKENSSNSDLSDDIIRNITYLLDNLLENYKLRNGEGKKSLLDHDVIINPEYSEDQKFKRSFVYLPESPSFNLDTCKPIITGDFSQLLRDSQNQKTKNITLSSNNNLLNEINKILSSQKFNSFIIRNRRGTNEKQPHKIITDYDKKLFRDEINALYNIVENIKRKLYIKKIMDSVEKEDNISDEDEIFQNTEESNNIPMQDSTSNQNENQLHSLGGNDTKVEEILETIENIGRELKQIDFKDKFLSRILDPEVNNRKEENMHRNKIKNNRKSYYIKSSFKSNVGSHGKPVRNNHEKINKNIKKYTKVTKEKKKTTLPPCCETEETTIPLGMDQGNHLTIEWCCGSEVTGNFFSTNGNSESSVVSTLLSTESVATSAQKSNQTEGQSSSSSVQNAKQTAESTTSSTNESKLTEKSTFSTSATTNTSQSTSTIQTSKPTRATKAHFTKTTKKHLKKRNHNHGHQINKKYFIVRKI